MNSFNQYVVKDVYVKCKFENKAICKVSDNECVCMNDMDEWYECMILLNVTFVVAAGLIQQNNRQR